MGGIYVLACRECAAGDTPEDLADEAIPFGTPAERGRWARLHTDATGHDSWWVKDLEDEMER